MLSHVTRPSRSPQETADDLAFIVAAVLAGAPMLARQDGAEGIPA